VACVRVREHDEGLDELAAGGVRGGDDGGFDDVGELLEDGFDFEGAYRILERRR
jgi:hypothetical protein